jgi:2-hydroxy-3-keto-5-methylthiopentenyl-1-phosphate phosphatase
VTDRPIEILCDFDGTIARVDTVDLLLERLADSSWRLLEEQWIGGHISSRECMAGQIPLLRGGWPAIAKVLAEVELAPSFSSFAAWCREVRAPLRVVSDGLDRVIEHLLAREAIEVDEVWASRLVDHPDGRLGLDFPQMARRAFCGADFCKCALFPDDSGPRPLRILVGDGRSDFCCAGRADVVFACSKLALHCRQNDIAFVPFEDFEGVRRFVEARLEGFGSSRTSAAASGEARS